MNTLDTFLGVLTAQLEKGIYVWGGDGERLDTLTDPEAWIRKHETSTTNGDRAVTLYRKRLTQKVGEIRAFDCSGLVYYCLKQAGAQQSDISSRGLYARCTALSKEALQAGDLVFHHSAESKRVTHVGVYVGNGKTIECKGRDVGVVQSSVNASYWNRFGRFPALKVSETQPQESYDEINEAVIGSVLVDGVKVRGNVRSGPSTAEKRIGYAYVGERFDLYGVENNFCRINFHGTAAYLHASLCRIEDAGASDAAGDSPTSARTLCVSSPLLQGNDVMALQTRLNAPGYDLGKGGVDGKYGADTAAAVQKLTANAAACTKGACADAAVFALLGLS